MAYLPDTMDKSELLVRQAIFVYEGARLAAIAAQAPIVPAKWEDREEPFRKQFLEVIQRQMGADRSKSPKALHESWMDAYYGMGWAYGPVYDPVNKKHPDLVAYEELEKRERDKDAIFVALCEIARKWVEE